jgi:DNA-binding NarL/FixJ family response regulator
MSGDISARPARPRTVLLAESQRLYIDALHALIEQTGRYRVVAHAADGLEAVRLHAQHRPDAAILTAQLAALNGVDAARRIVEVQPAAAVLILAHDPDAWSTTAVFDAGARGCLFTSCPCEELVRALDAVTDGTAYLCPRAIDHFVQIKTPRPLSTRQPGAGTQGEIPSTPPPDALTPKERGVLQLVAEGLSSKEIADRLGVSLKTVETHRTNIMRKLELRNVACLTRYAIRHGLATAEA